MRLCCFSHLAYDACLNCTDVSLLVWFISKHLFSISFISLKFFCFLLTNVCLLTALISFVFKNIFPPSCISHYSVLPTFLVTAFFVLIQVTDCLASRTPVFFPKMFQHDRKIILSTVHLPVLCQSFYSTVLLDFVLGTVKLKIMLKVLFPLVKEKVAAVTWFFIFIFYILNFFVPLPLSLTLLILGRMVKVICNQSLHV